ncbi:MAG: peptidase domain-containing ABC transporter [Pseudomonas sp.]
MLKTNRLALVRQAEASECGLACITMIANFLGHDLSLATLRNQFPSTSRGMTLSHILQVASALELQPRPLRLELENLAELKLPCLLHWDFNHYVVLEGVSRNALSIYDPARGKMKVSTQQARDSFTGIAVEFSRTAGFSSLSHEKTNSLKEVFASVSGLKSTFAYLVALAIVLELISLATPLYFQWSFDRAFSLGDTDLLMPLAMLFIGIAALQLVFSISRGWLLSLIGMRLNTNWLNGLYRHILDMPLDWYEKRFKGDLLSRFSSVKAIQTAITTNSAAAILDGLTSVAIILLLSVYSTTVAILVLSCLATYLLAKALIYPRLRNANIEHIDAQSKQQHELVETFSAILPIKVNNKQFFRQIRYRNAVSTGGNADLTQQRLSYLATALNQFISFSFRVLIIWVGILQAARSEISVGMLLAILTYADMFIVRATRLIDTLMEFKMLNVHFERVMDVVHNQRESVEPIAPLFSLTRYDIEAKNLCYRYSAQEPWILNNMNFRIAHGESVALVGPSGTGKTTLAKVIVGLFQPTDGELTIDQRSISSLGLYNYRQLIGTVMQEDSLLSGSIFENISFFDPDATFQQVEQAAQQACVDADIVRMTMGYHTRVGDMGSSLSGGQTQRILLARAFYRKPKVLVLDEATSHLDIDLERRVNQNIKSMNITKIIIAHRPETIKSADRVIDLGNRSC